MKSLAKICISQYQIESIIGIHPHERNQQQILLFDIELVSNIKKAAQSDNIKDTIDYEQLTNELKNFVSQKKYLLLETLIEQLMHHLMTKYQPLGLRIRINKPNALKDAKCVSITMERGKI